MLQLVEQRDIITVDPMDKAQAQANLEFPKPAWAS